MAAEWYYSKGNQQQGPVSASELKQMAQSGHLAPGDLIWKEGMKDWKRADLVQGLFPEDARPLAAKPPALPAAALLPSSNSLQRVIQWFTFGSQIPQPLPFETPWDVDERTAPNKSDIYRAIAAVPLAVVTFPSLLIGLLFPPLLLLGLWTGALLAAVIFWKGFGRMQVIGRWVAVDDKNLWIEFLQGGEYCQSDGMTGRWDFLKNGKFIDIYQGRQPVDCLKVFHLQGGLGATLEVQNREGHVLSFKKGKTLAEQEVAKRFAKLNPFAENRAELLVAVWREANESEKWLQFTDDGAFVDGDGAAGRYAFSGEQPDETVAIQLTDGTTRTWKVVSLTTGQLVVAEDGKATTFRKQSHSARQRDAASATADDNSTPNPQGEGRKGLFGKAWGFLTKQKCPQCGQRAGKQISTKALDRRQEVGKWMENGQWVQKWMNVTTYRIECKCDSCGHSWSYTETNEYPA